MTKLKKARLLQNLSQETIAKKIGCSQTHYSALELGQRKPSGLHLTLLTETFDCTPNELGYRIEPTLKVIKED